MLLAVKDMQMVILAGGLTTTLGNFTRDYTHVFVTYLGYILPEVPVGNTAESRYEEQ
jgi:hypothetical protein